MKYIKEFGIKIAVLQFFSKILLKFFKNAKITVFVCNAKHKAILNYLRKKYYYVIDEYKNKNEFLKFNRRIWIFWWQGIENAPDLVKKCIYNVKKYCKNVIVIDKTNYNKYLNLEDYIINKYNLGLISTTHLSDIIRMRLLSIYGGYWFDATIFLTDNFFDNIDSKEFYTPKLTVDNNKTIVSKGKWCVFLMGGENITLFSFVNKMFKEYLKNHNLFIDYFLMDYFIALAYDNINMIKELIDNNKENNLNIFDLNKLMNKKYDSKIFELLKKNNFIHKLSYKNNLEVNKDCTFYKVVICNEK